MNKSLKYSTAITFIWIGFVGAISFMEAWLKFQAPNITIKLGLGIGQLVFKALNYVEIFCASSIFIYTFIDEKSIQFLAKKLFFIPFTILVFQTVWLLPQLDARAVAIISNIEVSDSKLHVLYIVLEVVKIIGLLIFGRKCIIRLNDREFSS